MKLFVKQYKVNEKIRVSKSTNLVYSFIITVIASLIFNGFIINDHKAIDAQIIFMTLATGLLSTHWYAKSFMVQRYEKKNSYFRVNNLISILFLAFMALSIDLLVFRENKSDPLKKEFLWEVATYLFIGAYIGSRLMIGLNYLLAFLANKGNDSIRKLTFWKFFSRFTVILLAVVHMVLFSQGVNSHLLIYIMMPLYILVEFLGNVWNVTDKVLKNSSPVEFKDLKERYSKLNVILISSIFISGSIQFAWYFTEHAHLYMLGRALMMYLIGFGLWWTYSNRIYRFEIKQDAKSLTMLSALNILIAISLVIIGGFIINANTDTYRYIIIPCVTFGVSAFILLINLASRTFTHQDNFGESFTKKEKKKFILQSIIPFFSCLILAITSLFISMSIWWMYGVVLTSLIILIVTSRYTIQKYIKK